MRSLPAAAAWADVPVTDEPAGHAAASRSAWDMALLAASAIAVDPRGLGGIRLQARPGPVRDRWLEELARGFGPAVPVRRVAASVPAARLLGGLDLGRTLALGRPAAEPGVLAAVDGGVLVLGMAERALPCLAAVIAAALDQGEVRVERDGLSARHPARFALIALDEGIDEAVSASLSDRLGLRLDLDGIGWRETDRQVDPTRIIAARQRWASVVVPSAITEALCALSLAGGGSSLRLPLHLLRASRASAALRGSDLVERVDAEAALHLVLGLPAPADETVAGATATEGQEPRDIPPETIAPGGTAAQPPSPVAEPPSASMTPQGKETIPSAADLQEIWVEAMGAHRLPHLLDGLAPKSVGRRTSTSTGKAGEERASGRRGRVTGISATPPFPGARPDVLATLRQAAPWQRIRVAMKPLGPAEPPRLRIRAADFRYLRRRERAGTVAIFVVDASGSAAVERLAETKGAIELLLADCYVRRDSVGLIAFRGQRADTLLEPTRSLVRAKRSLTALPGGGGTPLASAVLASLDMATASPRKGQTVITVFLTDGRGNVALDGSSGRDRVQADTQRAAHLFRRSGVRAIVIDTGQRGKARAAAFARDLGAEYLVLPRGAAGAMAQAVGVRMEG